MVSELQGEGFELPIYGISLSVGDYIRKNNVSQVTLLEYYKVLEVQNSAQKPDVSFLQFGDGDQ